MTDVEAQKARARAALEQDDLEALEQALGSLPRAELARAWDPESLLQVALTRRRGGSADLRPLLLLLRHGVDPNAEAAEWEGARFGRTALYEARSDVQAFAALLEHGADPDVLVSEYDQGVLTVRECLRGPALALVEARHPSPRIDGLTGAWELAAMQRAPGGLDDEEALADDEYMDNSECTVGFADADMEGRLELRDDGEALLVIDGIENNLRWIADADRRGFTWCPPEGDDPLDVSGLGPPRPVQLEGAVLPVWLGDRRFHFRRTGTFHREPVRRQ